MTRPTTFFKRPILAAMLVACGAAAQAADKLTVQLDWLPGGDKSFVYAGVQQGFFKDEFEASIPRLRNEISQRDGLGKFEPRLLAATWGWVAQSMSYDLKKVDPETLVDRRFLSQ